MGKNNSISARPSTGTQWAHLWSNLYYCLLDIGFFNLWLGFFLNVFRCLELLSANSVKQPSKSLNHVRCKLCVSFSCFLIFWGKATQNYYVPMFECCMRVDFWERWCSEMHHPMCYKQTWLQFDLHQFDPRHWFHVLYQQMPGTTWLLPLSS